MITTLTLNPAIDKTLILENFVVNGVNRIKNVNIDAGGKGINASKVIKALGEKTIALGFLGGEPGNSIISMLKDKGIEEDFIRIKEDTRINTKIVDIVNNTCTDLNENGPVISSDELKELMKKISIHSQNSDFFILSGNAQASIPISIYKDIINSISKSTKTILDASGDLLKEGVKAIPWMIKPNIAELRELTGRNINTIDELILECKNILNLGISYICVSLGEDGLILMSKDRICLATPPKVIAKSTVGAGDSVVASLAVSFLHGENINEAAKKACAISAASVTLENTGVPRKEIIDSFYNLIKIKNY